VWTRTTGGFVLLDDTLLRVPERRGRSARVQRLATWAVVAGALVVLGCTEPDFLEADCTNRADDDEDGAVDCDDSDCSPSGVCEDVRERCADGVDNDRDGRADCESESCVAAGFCEPFVPEDGCDVAEQTGCPRGLGCWVVGDEPTCAPLVGAARRHGEACDLAVAVSAGCAAGHLCLDDVCWRSCRVDGDCPIDSRCLTDGAGGVGSCTIACNPIAGESACEDDAALCAPLAAFIPEIPFRQGGGLFSCIAADPSTVGGTLGPGARCGGVTSRCRRDLVCAPDLADRQTCRESCFANAEGPPRPSTGCSQPEDVCWPTYASHPAIERGAGVVLIQGTCWAPGER
jgi:hypothetical protein